MINKNLNFFEKNGYLLLNNCFSDQEVDNLRGKIKKLSNNSKESSYLLLSSCLKEKEIFETIFNKKLVEAYKELIQDDIYLIPELHVQINHFPKNNKQGWHYDGQSERQHKYLKDPKRKFFRVGIYLQDNNKNFGGGIDILKSKLFKKLPFKIPNRLEKKIIEFYTIFFSSRVDTKKGSVIIFDSRLPHKGTFPLKNPSENEFRDKYTIYFQIGNKEHCNYFLKNSIDRMFINYKRPKAVNYFLDYLKLSFPEDYPSEFAKMLKDNKINLLSSNNQDSKFFKEFEKFIN